MRTELSTSMEAKAIREERQREKRVPPLFSLLCLRLSLESFSLSKVAHEGERMRLALFQGRNVCLGLLFQLLHLVGLQTHTHTYIHTLHTYIHYIHTYITYIFF